MNAQSGDKAALRVELRRRRRALSDRPERSARVCTALVGLAEMSDAARVLVYDAVPGEPELDDFVRWCAGHDIVVSVPEHDPLPGWADVVVVPGVAFTRDGDRLGQGGGWYDRFLTSIRPDCVTVGVCFEPSIVDHLPTESHDVAVDVVVTDDGVWRRGATGLAV